MYLLQPQIMDVGNFKDLSEQISTNNKLIIAFGIVMLFDVVLLAIRIWSDFSIKKMDKEIYSANLKEQKRIDILEKAYDAMNEITYIDPMDSGLILAKVTDLERYFNMHFLYMPKEIEKIIFTFTDYNKLVSSNFTQKNFDTEVKILTGFKEYFNKN